MKMRLISLALVVVMVGVALTGCTTTTDAEAPNPFSDRFVELDAGDWIRAIVDKETGVCYLWRERGYGGGMTVLLDADGTPLTYEDAWYQTYQEADHAE
jgi:hypothetical protein